MSEQKRKVGRPRKGESLKTHLYSCRFDDEEYEKLFEVSKYRGISRTDFIVNAINEVWNEDHKKKS